MGVTVLNYFKRKSRPKKCSRVGRYLGMKRAICLVTLCSIVSLETLFAQKPAVAPATTPPAVDSTRQVRSETDTIPGTVRRNGVPVKTSPFTLNDNATALDKPDTVRLTTKQEAQIHKIIPKKATLRSVMLPGLGQAYNRQYYKIPFVYVGFGVMGYLFVKYRGLAKEAETGYRRLLYGDLISEAYTVSYPAGVIPDALLNTSPISVSAVYEKVSSVEIGVNPFMDDKRIFTTTTGAKNAYDTFRRYRDLNILLSVVLYAVNIIEANVAAHLKTFDLTDDISMQVEPHVLPMPGTGPVPGVRVAFTLK